jgi:hypothetical protein
MANFNRLFGTAALLLLISTTQIHCQNHGNDDPDQLNECVSAFMAMQTSDGGCGQYQQEIQAMGEMASLPGGTDLLAEMDVEDMCRPISGFVDCTKQALEPCEGLTNPMFKQLVESVTSVHRAVNLVCDTNIELVKEKKACLLRRVTGDMAGGPGPDILLANTMMRTCMHLLPRPGRQGADECFSPALVRCGKQVITNQCGPEIADVIEQVVNEMGSNICAGPAAMPHKKFRRTYHQDLHSLYKRTFLKPFF